MGVLRVHPYLTLVQRFVATIMHVIYLHADECLTKNQRIQVKLHSWETACRCCSPNWSHGADSCTGFLHAAECLGYRTEWPLAERNRNEQSAVIVGGGKILKVFEGQICMCRESCFETSTYVILLPKLFSSNPRLQILNHAMDSMNIGWELTPGDSLHCT